MQITNARVAIDEINAIKERLENGFKRIYGDDIALTPDTPDGQMIGLFSEALDEVNQCLIFAVQMLDPYLAQGEDLYASRLYSLINEASGFEILSLSIDGTQSKAIGVREIAVLLSKDIEILVV